MVSVRKFLSVTTKTSSTVCSVFSKKSSLKVDSVMTVFSTIPSCVHTGALREHSFPTIKTWWFLVCRRLWIETIGKNQVSLNTRFRLRAIFRKFFSVSVRRLCSERKQKPACPHQWTGKSFKPKGFSGGFYWSGVAAKPAKIGTSYLKLHIERRHVTEQTRLKVHVVPKRSTSIWVKKKYKKL